MGTTRDRALSPAVGVILLVAVTVVLGTLVATGVFGALDGVGSTAPDADFAFWYSEEYNALETDSFGSVGQTSADGITRITVERAPDAIPVEELFLVVGSTENNWGHHQTQYSVNDTIGSGNKIDVWAARGDEIQVIWRDQDGDSSAILDSFTVPKLDALAPPPEPDVGCPWVENQLAPGPEFKDPLTIDNRIVECDLDQYNVTKLEIINDGAVIGEVEADGDIDLRDGVTYEGDVVMLSGGNDIDLDDGSEINGDVDAQGGVALDAGSVIEGDVHANDDVDIDGNSRVSGKIETDANVKLNEEGSGAVTVEEGIAAAGDVDIYDGSTVQGDVHSTNSGSITMTDSTVLGAVATGEDVDVDGSTVQNHVYEDNGFSCDSSEINGQNCGSYTPEDYGDY